MSSSSEEPDSDDEIMIPDMEQVSDAESAEKSKLQGNEAYKKGDYRGAIAFYTTAIETAPLTVAYYGNRAAANFMLLKYKEVIEDCNFAVTLDRSFLKCYSRKAKAQLCLGNIAGAISTYQDALLTDPNHSATINEKREAEVALDKIKRGRDYMTESKFVQALSCFDSVLKIVTGSRQVKLLRAEALMGRERYDEAFAVLTQLMRSSSDTQTPELLYLRARCLYFQGEFPNAIKHLKMSLHSDPDNVKYIKEIKRIRQLDNKKEDANAAFKQASWQEAIDKYSDCLLLDPKNKPFNAKLHSNRATAYSKLLKYDEAIKDCDTALYYDASYAKAVLRKAVCLRAKGEVGDLDQALREYDRAMKMVSAEAQRDLASAIRETKLELKKAKRIDYYKLLGVYTSATAHDIKKAYRKMALVWHPDRHANSTEEEKIAAEKKFKEIGNAYAILSDPEKKARYDNGQDEDGSVDFDGGHGQGGGDPQDMFNMFFGGGGRGGPRGGGCGGRQGNPFG